MDDKVKKVAPPETPPAPEVNAQGVKVYPTSFIPQKGPMEESRVPTAKLDNFHIEVVHIAVFVAIVLALYWSLWMNAKKTNRD